jgi:hypothetical protein
VHCSKICRFSCNVDISSPQSHVFCLSSSSAKQQSGVSFHFNCYKCLARQKRNIILRTHKNKLDSQEDTVSAVTRLVASISTSQLQVDTRDSPLLQKWPGCHTDHSSPTSAKVNTERSYTCAPPICLHDMTFCAKNKLKGRQVNLDPNSLECHIFMLLSKYLGHHYRGPKYLYLLSLHLAT